MKKIIIILLFLFIIIFLYVGPFNSFIGFFSGKDAKKAVNSIDAIKEAVESYIIDWGFSPKINNIDTLSAIITNTYDKKIPVKDPWGNKILYEKIGKDGYKITIIGKDKKPNTIDDLIYNNGKYEYNRRNKKYDKILKQEQ